MIVWIYVDTDKQVGDDDHLKVFSSQDVADEWFKANDPEGEAFEYEMIATASRQGKMPKRVEHKCPVCKGAGLLPVKQPAQPGRRIYPARCKRCDGKGWISKPG
jgi:DnaJ-class molecular chaperone